MAAAVGNQYALGCVNSGRQPKYKSVEEMQFVIDKYFDKCNGEVLKDEDGELIYDKHGQPVMISKPPTVTGMALALGFTSRQALLNYQDKEEFVDTISIAKARVEAYTEARLFDRDGVNGAKFSLTNNFKGWKDITTVEQTGPNGGPLLLQNVTAMSDADLKLMVEIMERSQIQGEVVDITPDNED